MYPSFPLLRPTVILATIFTTIQSLAWIAGSITSIIAYYCQINVEVTKENVVKSILGLTMYRQYFKNDECLSRNFNDSIFSVLDDVQTVSPVDIHAISWTFLTISFFWFVAGLLLVIYVTKYRLKNANFFIYFWIFNTLIVSIADVVVGIFMSRDYFNLSNKIEDLTFEYETAEKITVLLTARTVSWLMIAISFRGFVLWLINVSLALYMIRHVFAIQHHNQVRSGFDNHGYIHNETRHKNHILGYDAFAPKAFYGNSDSLTEIPRPKITKAQTLNNHQRAAVLSLHLNHNPDKEFSYLEGGRTRPSSAFVRGYNNKKSPRPDYSPTLPRALRLPDSIIDEHPQAVLRQSKNLRRF
ncbi:uncharacterized protein LOC134831182 [Culicoides brevitarsis]|uniref:uncharacterized protein LOC134831182 n=1 Tax=Culicoides brevitarsis TaxID=469753 RepID=UPI00307B1DE6